MCKYKLNELTKRAFVIIAWLFWGFTRVTAGQKQAQADGH